MLANHTRAVPNPVTFYSLPRTAKVDELQPRNTQKNFHTRRNFIGNPFEHPYFLSSYVFEAYREPLTGTPESRKWVTNPLFFGTFCRGSPVRYEIRHKKVVAKCDHMSGV